MKKYNLYYLLTKQPREVKINKYFNLLKTYYNSSGILKNLIFSHKCYLLLNHAKIKPGKIKIFYKIFNLPENPFFPLFLKIKSGYKEKQNIHKKKLIEYKLKKIKELPAYIQDFIKHFANYEKSLNLNQKYTVWHKIIFPGSKKKADSLKSLNKTDWINIFIKLKIELIASYKKASHDYIEKIISLFILELTPLKNEEEKIKAQYRKLSKTLHPDTGGNAAEFNLLQNAYKFLIRKV